MSLYNGWSDVPLEPRETYDERAEIFDRKVAAARAKAEAFVRGMTEVDEAGDMLAELRYQIADLLAERGVAQLVIAELTRERDEARAALLRRMSKDDTGGA